MEMLNTREVMDFKLKEKRGKRALIGGMRCECRG